MNNIIEEERKKSNFKKFCIKNPTYYKDYYLNNLKYEYIYCYCCNREYLKTHKARHEKTIKHHNNKMLYGDSQRLII